MPSTCVSSVFFHGKACIGPTGLFSSSHPSFPSFFPFASSPSWSNVVAIIYSLGVVTVLGNIALGIIKVQYLIKKGVKENLYGTEIIVCDGKIAPFSWMKWIVMCRFYGRSSFRGGNKWDL